MQRSYGDIMLQQHILITSRPRKWRWRKKVYLASM